MLLFSYKSPDDPDAIFSPIRRKLLSTFESPICSCSSSILCEVAEFVGFDNEACIIHEIQVYKENVKLMCSFFCLILLGTSTQDAALVWKGKLQVCGHIYQAHAYFKHLCKINEERKHHTWFRAAVSLRICSKVSVSCKQHHTVFSLKKSMQAWVFNIKPWCLTH